MPLPAALLAKLKKRGLVRKTDDIGNGPEEEVIAEDYDDQIQTNKLLQFSEDGGLLINFEGGHHQGDLLSGHRGGGGGGGDKQQLHDPMLETMLRQAAQGDSRDCAFACPNKWNIYHLCTRYCHEHWSLKHPSPNTERKRIKMIKKYPLPENWKEIYDAGVGRHYYWRIGSEEVSWLPPNHPRSKISVPANKLRAIWKDSEARRIRNTPPANDDGSDGEDEDDEDMEDEEEDAEEERREKERENRKKAAERYKGKGRTGRGNPELDPMDPAAYSECGRGTWSTGLEKKGEAKTGADVTAAGPLYQMRPYPSPGAILRMNAGMKGKPTPGDE